MVPSPMGPRGRRGCVTGPRRPSAPGYGLTRDRTFKTLTCAKRAVAQLCANGGKTRMTKVFDVLAIWMLLQVLLVLWLACVRPGRYRLPEARLRHADLDPRTGFGLGDPLADGRCPRGGKGTALSTSKS